MNGALATTMLGVTFGGIITLFALAIHIAFLRLDRLEDKVDKCAAATKDLEVRLTDPLRAIDDKFKQHGERLARGHRSK